MNKLLIFDFDGTITIGSNEEYLKCFIKAIESTNTTTDKTTTYNKILTKWGQGREEIFKYILKDNPEEINKAVEYFDSCVFRKTFFDNIQLIDHTKRILEDLKSSGNIIAIASGSTRYAIDYLLKKFEMENIFSEITSIDDTKNAEQRKPNPYILNLIIQKYNFQKSDIYYIGDAKSDIKAGKHAKIKTIAVLTGHLNLQTARAIKPDVILKDITQIKTLFESPSLLPKL